jgi:hypothetical protein
MEISGAGSVPELLVTNRERTPVLLLDGEELAGAKQNRVLNTTILIREASETRIPVSCTEQGRWAYTSPSFADSGNVMAVKARALKSRSVSHSLEGFASFKSDQGEVWQGIAELQAKAGFHSPTSAMKDLFKAREDDLRRCDEIFHCVPGQVGLLAFVDGRAVGFDIISLSSVYSQLHRKLVRSYALESLIESRNAETPTIDSIDLARRFIEEAMAAGERSFPSVGCGLDYRYRGESIAGAALVHENEVIHAAFFQMDPARRAADDNMTSLRNRRRYFRG